MAILTVGAGLEYPAIAAAVAAANSGDTINVRAGTYTNDFPALIDGLTIQGVGGIVHLVATAQPTNGKAIFDVTGTTTLKNLDFSGAAVSNGNGAGVRYEGGTLFIENSSFENNQEGITAVSDPAGTIRIDQSEFSHNGAGDEQTANIDLGQLAEFLLTGSYVHDAVGGSEVKSRAETNVIYGTRIYDNAGHGTYSVDLPNGGTATITHSFLEKGANAQNGTMIAYGEEGASNVGTSVNMGFNELVSDRSSGSTFWNAGSAVVTSSYSVFWNLSDGLTYGSKLPSNPGDEYYLSPIDTDSVDTRAPEITASESVSGWTNLTSNTLSGTVSDSDSGVASVEVYDSFQGKTIHLGAATLSADGSWSFVATGLADGSHRFLLQAYDNFGNVAGPWAGPADMVDTAGPTLTAGQSVSGTTSSHGIALSGTIADNGSDVAAVEILDQTGGKWVDLGQATLTGGTWKLTKGDLTAGSHSFFAVATDTLGNPSVAAAGAPLTVVAAEPLQPTLQRIVGNVDGGVTLLGTAAANSKVTITDTSAGVTRTLGSTVANAAGAYSLMNHVKISLAAVNTFAASASDATGHEGTNTGLFQLSSVASDTLSGTVGQSDVFATFLRTGQDTIAGFETTKAAGAAHDVINLSGTGYGYYAQVAPHISGASSAVIQLDATRSVTVLGVSAASLQASDFRFS